MITLVVIPMALKIDSVDVAGRTIPRDGGSIGPEMDYCVSSVSIDGHQSVEQLSPLSSPGRTQIIALACMASSETIYYLGIDVGTGSARAALVTADGTVLASASQDTKTWRDQTDHRIFEQSTDDVWRSICSAVREVIAQSKVSPKHVKGIGFDATCSLAVTNWEGESITVTRGHQLGEVGERNIVLWADHRAEKEADLINATGSSVLDYVGGVISVRRTFPSLGASSRCLPHSMPCVLTGGRLPQPLP
jgi:hypothetical protein